MGVKVFWYQCEVVSESRTKYPLEGQRRSSLGVAAGAFTCLSILP